MAIDCTKPNLSQQEQSLCSCKLATETMIKTLNQYTKDYLAYTDYIANRNNIIEKHNKWRNMSGEFSNWATRKKQLQNERRNTRNWACEGASWDGRGGWCSNDHGGDWEFDHHSKDSWQVCSFTHKCRIKGDAINRILTDEGYNRAEPSIPGERQPPRFDSQNNIQCCSQIFSDISVQGGAAEFSGINQNCQQRITNELNKPAPTPAAGSPLSTSTPSTSTPSTSTPSTSTPSTSTPSTSTPSTSTNQQMIIIVIVIVIILLMSCSSSIGGLFLMNTSEE
jgi:hypothetical protein